MSYVVCKQFRSFEPSFIYFRSPSNVPSPFICLGATDSPDERRGPGGKRYDDDYDGPGARSEGNDNWRRMGQGGGGGDRSDDRRGGDYDHERGGMAPDDGTWRSRAPPPRSGGGVGAFDRDGGGSRGGGNFDDRRGGPSGGRDSGYGDPPAASAERPRLQLVSRKAPPPLPPITAKVSTVAPAPAPKPSGPRSNPFGAAQAVDTTERDREIEAKAEAERQAALRHRDEGIRSSGAPLAGKTLAAGELGDASPTQGTSINGETGVGEEEGVAAVEDGEASAIAEEAPAIKEDGKGDETTAAATDEAGDEEIKRRTDEPAAPPKPAGRWAALRRETGGDDRAGPSTGAFPRRDRVDDRRDGAVGRGNFEGRGREDRSSFGRREDGGSATGGFGSRMDREPAQPPAPPAGNAFAKRFGSNFDRESDRSYPRPGGGMGGGFERRDDDRRGTVGGGGGFDRRDDDRRGGMGMGGGFERRDEGRFDRRDEERRSSGGGSGGGIGGISRFSRDERSEGYQRRSSASSPEQPPAPPVRDSVNKPTVPPPSSVSKVSITDSKKSETMSSSIPAEAEAAAAAAPEPAPEPEVEAVPEREPEPEPEPKEDPEEVARASAAEAMATGKRGKDLKEFVLAQERKTTAGALLKAALIGNTTPEDMKWAAKDEFGAALTALSEGSTEQQIGIIYAVVAKCHEMGFPKVGTQAVVQAIFMGMYNADICEEDAFVEWKVSTIFLFHPD